MEAKRKKRIFASIINIINMDIAVENGSNYWFLLKSLSREMKEELIKRLANSISKKDETSAKVDAKRFYGCWKDDDFPMDANTMVVEIKEARHFKDDIAAF